LKSEKVRFEMASEINAEIIRKLVAFVEAKLGRYEVGDRIFAEIKRDQLHIRGTVGLGFPKDFMKELGITTEEELFEALKSVTTSPRLGESSPFSATFLIPASKGSE
jgi:hypothetical protein